MVQVALALPPRCEGPNLTDIIVLGLNHENGRMMKACAVKIQTESVGTLNQKGSGSRR
jgi:hypothetical protein